MIIANQWYNIAKTSTLGSTTGIRIEFGSYYALVRTAVDYGNIVITAVESNISEEKIKVGVRIRYNRGWFADVRISPTIDDADLKASVYENNGWTAVSPNTSTAGSTVCIINDVISQMLPSSGGESLWERVNVGTEEEPKYALVPKEYDGFKPGIVTHTFVTFGGMGSGATGEGGTGNGAVILDGLEDVQIINPTPGQVLTYDETTGLWINKSTDFVTQQYVDDAVTHLSGNITTLQGYFFNGAANNALKLGGQLPEYYATATGLTALSDRVAELEKYFYFDKERNAVCVKEDYNFIVPKYITFGGLDTGSGEGGGGLSRVTIYLGETPYTSETGVVRLPAYPVIPTDISAFNNDKAYATVTEVNNAISTAVTPLSGNINTLQGSINTLQGYFTDGSANNALKLGGQLPEYYATNSALTAVSDRVVELEKLFYYDAEHNAVRTSLSLIVDQWLTFGGAAMGSGSVTGATTLAGLNDVQITEPADGQSLVYDAAQGLWVNKAVSGGVSGDYLPITGGTLNGHLEVMEAIGIHPNTNGYSGMNFYMSTTTNENWHISARGGESGKPFRFYHSPDGSTVNQVLDLTSSGNVLIGTTTDNGYKLDVAGTLNATTIYQNGQTLDKYYLPLSGGMISSPTYAAFEIYRSNANDSAIKYSNSSRILGYIGVGNANGEPFFNPTGDSSTRYTIYHEGNLNPSDYLPKSDIGSQSVNYANRAGNVLFDVKVTLLNSSHNLNDYRFGYLGSSGTDRPANDLGYNTGILAFASARGYDGCQIGYAANASINLGYTYLAVRSEYNGTKNWTQWYELLHSGNIGSYNAGSATKLANARLIFGQSFNGENNVSGTAHIGQGTNGTATIDAFGGLAYFGCDAVSNGAVTSTTGAYIAVKGTTGNVLVGTTTDKGHKLFVNGDAYFGNANAEGIIVGAGLNAIEGASNGSYSGKYNLYINYYSSGYLSLCNGGGNVLIGTATDSSYKLYINDTNSNPNAVYIRTANTSGEASIYYHAGNSGYQWVAGISCGFPNYNYYSFYSVTAGKAVAYVSHTGNFVATGSVTFNLASDRRLKSNIKPLTYRNTMRVLHRLRPVSFEWNETAVSLDSTRQGLCDGFIADEYEGLIPNSGRDIWEKYRAIDYTRAIPYLAKGWQIHESELDKMRRKVKIMEMRIEHLENLLVEHNITAA